MKRIYDIIIIGGGPAGYTAALYGARSGLDTIVLEKLSAGGQMALTTQIDNYPGFDDGIDGFELGEKMQSGAEKFGAQTELAEVLSVDFSKEIKEVETSEGMFYGRTVIIAGGAVPKKLGFKREEELTGRGVNYCAACDGMFYKGKTVIVSGGGNSAVADALILSRIAKKVIIVHRRDTLKADKVYHEQLENAGNVEFLWNSTIEDVIYDDSFKGVIVRSVLTGEEKEVASDGLFISIGRAPDSKIYSSILNVDENGYIIADETTRTNIDGVFAAGDIRTKALRQIVTAVSDGATAVHFAQEYLANVKKG